MSAGVDWKRVLVFIAFAFGIAWLVGLVLALTGGLVNSPVVFDLPGAPITLALLLLALGYMLAPAIAHLLTRLVTREGWRGLYLRPALRHGWPYWLSAWLGTPVLVLLGTPLFFALFPQFFDAELSTLRASLPALPSGADSPAILWGIVAAQTAVGALIAPIANGPFTLGEEFGWRAYLLQKLTPLGLRRALVLTGVIWGVWHWPVIAMGHNYGLQYAGFPWLGMLAMVWFCVASGTFLGWASLRAGSVWPAVIGHASLNGVAGVSLLLQRGEANPLLGPSAVGVIGGIGLALMAIALLLTPRAAEPRSPEAAAALVEAAMSGR